MTIEKTPAGNTGLAKVAVQCTADTFVVNQSLVLRINICGEIRHLRQARKRYARLKTESPFQKVGRLTQRIRKICRKPKGMKAKYWLNNG
jgi:hypothetical protein